MKFRRHLLTYAFRARGSRIAILLIHIAIEEMIAII